MRSDSKEWFSWGGWTVRVWKRATRDHARKKAARQQKRKLSKRQVRSITLGSRHLLPRYPWEARKR